MINYFIISQFFCTFEDGCLCNLWEERRLVGILYFKGQRTVWCQLPSAGKFKSIYNMPSKMFNSFPPHLKLGFFFLLLLLQFFFFFSFSGEMEFLSVYNHLSNDYKCIWVVVCLCLPAYYQWCDCCYISQPEKNLSNVKTSKIY